MFFFLGGGGGGEGGKMTISFKDFVKEYVPTTSEASCTGSLIAASRQTSD